MPSDGDFSPPAAPSTAPAPVLKGREIIVAVCGGIAAYKVADVVSKLVQLGAGVTVVMTNEAQRFVAPLTFAALARRGVGTRPIPPTHRCPPRPTGLTESPALTRAPPSTNNTI